MNRANKCRNSRELLKRVHHGVDFGDDDGQPLEQHGRDDLLGLGAEPSRRRPHQRRQRPPHLASALDPATQNAIRHDSNRNEQGEEEEETICPNTCTREIGEREREPPDLRGGC